MSRWGDGGAVLQMPVAPVVTAKPGLPGAGVGTCGHNDWDHVRSAVGKAHLRCRQCQARVAVPLRDAAYRDRCSNFRSPSGCAHGSKCMNLHVRKDKQRLQERQKVHGDKVLQGVRLEQLPGLSKDAQQAQVSHTDPLRSLDEILRLSASNSKPVGDNDEEGPPPLLEDTSAGDMVDWEYPVIQHSLPHDCAENVLLPPGSPPPTATELAGSGSDGSRNGTSDLHPKPPPPHPGVDCRLVEDDARLVEDDQRAAAEQDCSLTVQDIMRRRGTMPCLFISVPYGPRPIVFDSAPVDVMSPLVRQVQQFVSTIQKRLKCVVLVTAAKKQAAAVTVSTSTRPRPLFTQPPAEIVQVVPKQYRWSCEAAPGIAAQIEGLLQRYEILADRDDDAGLGEQAWVAMALMFPNPTAESPIPVVQVSVRSDQTPDMYIQIGRALSPLREERVLIVGSGTTCTIPRLPRDTFSTVMPGQMRDQRSRACSQFDSWLRQTLMGAGMPVWEKDAKLKAWATAPNAPLCVTPGTEQNFLPLLVLHGTGAGDDCAALAEVNCAISHCAWSSFEWRR